jgi:hypothetical protein
MSAEELIPPELRDALRERTNWGTLLDDALPVDLESATSAGSQDKEAR